MNEYAGKNVSSPQDTFDRVIVGAGRSGDLQYPPAPSCFLTFPTRPISHRTSEGAS